MKRKFIKMKKLWDLYEKKDYERMLLCKEPFYVDVKYENIDRHKELTNELLEILDQMSNL